jgi:uncharacterized protein (TIGR02996 family)
MSALEGLLQSVVDEPACEANWLVLADWLEEHDDPRRAELLRLHRKLLATCCEPDKHPERSHWQARLVELLAQGVRPCVSQQTVFRGKRGKLPMTFAWIPPGTFLMGSPPDEAERSDDETQHRVTLVKGFYLGIYPVTQAQWGSVMGSKPSNSRNSRANHPVEGVSWDDCQEFCGTLGEATGKRFRLPTEAEWEYACRAGTTTPFHFGDTISTDQANYDDRFTHGGSGGTFREGTTPVGSFLPNAWGLAEMHGNVQEWCADLYAPYDPADTTDPINTSKGDARVLRGGSWYHDPGRCRSACRLWAGAGSLGSGAGCRVCLD